MAKVPRVVVKSTSADIKHAELQGTVTVGPESAERLTKLLGRKVEIGEQFDLGTIAVYDQNPWKRFWANLKIAIAHSKSPFRKPLEESSKK